MFRKSFIFLPVMALALAACSGSGKTNSTAASTVGTQAGSASGGSILAGGSAPKDLGNALNLAIGTNSKPSVFASYHLELTLDLPKAKADFSGVVNEVTKISADVQGKNIHIFKTDPGTTSPIEGFVIGDTGKEYKMVNGSPQAMIGQVALSWSFWPLDVVVPYAYGVSLHAEKTGEESVNERMATVYAFDSSKGDPAAIAAMSTGPIGLSQSKGTVWIDKETGGMLKLTLDYITRVSNKEATKSIGEGNGHIQLEVSNVGQTTVISPVK